MDRYTDGMRKLIVIEDEEKIRIGLAEMIPWEEIGFSVVASFEGGSKAKEWLMSHSVDVVITDIMMPDGSGIDVAEYLHDQKRMEVVIFYTAYKDFQYAQLGIRYGIHYYITKDMGYRELIDFLKDVKKDLDTTYHSVTLDKGNETQNTIGILMQYLEKDYRTTTLTKAAIVVDMNPSYLSTFIKDQLHTNFKTILAKIRMRKTIELLSDPLMKISDIYKLVGYTDRRSFIKNFKKEYKMTPGEYRKHHLFGE